MGTSGITYIGFEEWGMQDEPHKEALLTEGKQELCHKGSSTKEGRQWVSCYTTVGGEKKGEERQKGEGTTKRIEKGNRKRYRKRKREERWRERRKDGERLKVTERGEERGKRKEEK